MKTLTNYIKEDIAALGGVSEVPANFYRDCSFDCGRDQEAIGEIERAIDRVNSIYKGRAEAGIDEYDDIILFSVWGATEDDVEEYCDTLMEDISDDYIEMLDTHTGDIIKNV